MSAILLLSFLSIDVMELPSEREVKPVLTFRLPTSCDGLVFDQFGNGYVSQGRSITMVPTKGQPRMWATTGSPTGHRILADGSHLVCDPGQHAVLHLDAKGKMLPPAAKEFDAKAFHNPHDLAVDSEGGFYFTDLADSSNSKHTGSVYYVDAKGAIRLAAQALALPIGLALRPDGKTLLVSEAGLNAVVAFDVTGPGQLGPKKEFAKMPPQPGAKIQQPRGLCLDEVGNLYVACYGIGEVKVFDADGKLLRSYAGGTPLLTSLAFGGPKLDQLFITGGIVGDENQGFVFRLDLKGSRGLALLPKKPKK